MNTRNLWILSILMFCVFIVWCAGNKTSNSEDTEKKTLQEIVNATWFNISFVDPMWDGKTIPEGQWCSIFDGEGETPKLLIENIPDNTLALSISYSDRSFAANDNGWHGIIGITIEPWQTSVTIPSIPGETLALPDDMFVIEEARSQRSKGGVYLPPCSGWSGNEYYITVDALSTVDIENADILGSKDIEMWVY